MVKNMFGNLSRGFFFTIGKIIAFFFIGFIIVTIVTKLEHNVSDSNSFDSELISTLYR